jgi:putative flippase GtrA
VTSTAKGLLRYLITGGTAALVDIQGFALLSWAHVPVVLAAACSFSLATIVNFLLTSRWVFGATPTRQKYFAFLLGAVFGLLVNVALTYTGATYLAMQPVLAKTFAIAVTFLLNFWVNVNIVFRNPRT